MIPMARRNRIKEIINEKKSVTVSELAKTFKVTEETIRKDLQLLEEEGILTRTYGGAYISYGVENDVDINLREHIYVEGKEKIAKTCLKYINSGDSIFLDGSTTSLHIASNLNDKRITVTTNSIKIMDILSKNPNVKLIVIGGRIEHPSLSALGRNAESNIRNYFFDTAFISCRALSMINGITDSNEQQAEIRKIAMEHSNHTYLVADYTKFDRTAFTKICNFDKINSLVVDKSISPEWHNFLESYNINLIECE
ncbi:glucitol operon repressor [Clostridium homopropionicum DSM 5847]|uniref:Glucitol operon repressor n=1 Tax=Clostridium homopropionicum DSM 5847 TaxID=1121318 RepID=A0A0L6Z6K5_9CLOT|nr:DeoR/GlpR family DNA-binding transcription regulator [Clostridium homopropionicum]KOA18597.1 glucitol operon repressor [Clostridium homopropionicum DSM 5847]SFG49496.1 transcriptional regulator, DeoR family [Clostridium homopropionicum]